MLHEDTNQRCKDTLIYLHIGFFEMIENLNIKYPLEMLVIPMRPITKAKGIHIIDVECQ